MKFADLINEASEYMKNKPLLRSFQGESIVAGDIHGDIESLVQVMKFREKNGIKNLILLGDYVDRGTHQIEVIKMVCELVLNDLNFIPLRGNHEDMKICTRYGFIQKLVNANKPVDPFNNLFSNLPISAISEELFLVHGGVPVHPEFEVAEINNLPREWIVKENLLLQLLWNDPIFSKTDEHIKYRDSMRGYDCFEFGPRTTRKFLKMNNFKLIIRGHSYLKTGYKWAHSNKLLSLFTSKSGPYAQVRRSFAHVNNPSDIDIINIDD